MLLLDRLEDNYASVGAWEAQEGGSQLDRILDSGEASDSRVGSAHSMSNVDNVSSLGRLWISRAHVFEVCIETKRDSL